jgi:hypothetical protein
MLIPILNIHIQTAEAHDANMYAAFQAGKVTGMDEERKISNNTISDLLRENNDYRRRLGLVNHQ